MEEYKVCIAFIAMGFILSLIIESIILPKIILISRKESLFDVPDERKLHAFIRFLVDKFTIEVYPAAIVDAPEFKPYLVSVFGLFFLEVLHKPVGIVIPAGFIDIWYLFVVHVLLPDERIVALNW